MTLQSHLANETPELLTIEHMVQRHRVKGGFVEAVSDVSFSVARGETLGLVGESGCGKSSTARAVLQLPPPVKGRVLLNGTDLTVLRPGELRAARRQMHLIFQDPISALNPRRRVKHIVGEGLVLAGADKAQVGHTVKEVMNLVGLDYKSIGDRRPHELSGGQCQRVAIARALALRPALLICDEPVASLDVSIQGQVLNLLEDMRRDLGLAMLFISHDLAVVHNISDRIAVMYLGKIVELGSAEVVTRHPAHPYTRMLIEAIPTVEGQRGSGPSTVAGELPSALSPPTGCRFRTRCPRAQEVCGEVEPLVRDVGDGQYVACHFPLEAERLTA